MAIHRVVCRRAAGVLLPARLRLAAALRPVTFLPVGPRRVTFLPVGPRPATFLPVRFLLVVGVHLRPAAPYPAMARLVVATFRRWVRRLVVGMFRRLHHRVAVCLPAMFRRAAAMGPRVVPVLATARQVRLLRAATVLLATVLPATVPQVTALRAEPHPVGVRPPAVFCRQAGVPQQRVRRLGRPWRP